MTFRMFVIKVYTNEYKIQRNPHDVIVNYLWLQVPMISFISIFFKLVTIFKNKG